MTPKPGANGWATTWVPKALASAAGGLLCGRAVQWFDQGIWHRFDEDSPLRMALAKLNEAAGIFGFPDRVGMFASPLESCGWWLVPAVLTNGTIVDAHRMLHRPAKGPPSLVLERAVAPGLLHGSDIWHAFYETMSALSSEDDSEESIAMRDVLLENLARHYCRKFKDIARLQIERQLEVYQVDRDGLYEVRSVVPITLWQKNCSDGRDQLGEKPEMPQRLREGMPVVVEVDEAADRSTPSEGEISAASAGEAKAEL